VLKKLAKVIHCGRSQAYDLVNRGEIRSIRIGRSLRIPTAAIREVLTGTSAADPKLST
jgi:excisionase family DNA binding protein